MRSPSGRLVVLGVLGVLGALAASALVLVVVQQTRPTYCEAIADAKPRLTQATRAGSVAGVSEALPVLRDLTALAPQDLLTDWNRLTNAFAALSAALARTDLADDATLADVRKLPDAQQRRVQDAATDLLTGDVSRAADRIEQQARDVCHVELSV